MDLSSTQKPLSSFVFVDVRPEHFDVGRDVLDKYVHAARRDADIGRIELSRQLDLDNHFVLYRAFADGRSYLRHVEAGWVVRFRDDLQPVLGSPWDERLTLVC